jgi:hypothetical protein
MMSMPRATVRMKTSRGRVMMSMSMGRFGGVLPTSTRCALSCSLLACDVPRAPRRRELNSEAEAKAKAKAKERGARKQQAGSRAQEARRRPRAGRAQKSSGSSQHPRQPRLGRCLRPRCRPTERLGGQAPRSESRQSARGRQQHPRPPRLGRCLRHRCRPPTRLRCLRPRCRPSERLRARRRRRWPRRSNVPAAASEGRLGTTAGAAHAWRTYVRAGI